MAGSIFSLAKPLFFGVPGIFDPKPNEEMPCRTVEHSAFRPSPAPAPPGHSGSGRPGGGMKRYDLVPESLEGSLRVQAPKHISRFGLKESGFSKHGGYFRCY